MRVKTGCNECPFTNGAVDALLLLQRYAAAMEPETAFPLSFSSPGATACVWGRAKIARDTGAMKTAREFTVRLAELLSREHAAMADFLVALADFDQRCLWLDLGHSSLFYFLHRELGLSKGAAHYRKTAAEVIQNFPEIVEPLRDGRLCLSSIVHLAKVMTPENRQETLPRFFHRSRREAMEIAAEIHPAEAAPRRAVVTAIRSTSAALTAEAIRRPETEGAIERVVHPGELTFDLGQADKAVGESAPPLPMTPSCAPPSPPPPAKRDTAEPVTAELSRLHVTVSRRFLEKLEAARAALSHAHPGATAEEILEAGLDLVLSQHAKRKGLVKKPQRNPPPCKPDHVPAHVKRAVWIRDGGRCQWPLDGGGVCGSTLRVELDHIVPRARGGPSTIENTRLTCKLHNGEAARRAFGDEWMDRFTRNPRRARTG